MAERRPGGSAGSPPASRRERQAARREARQDARQAARRGGQGGGGTSNGNPPTTTGAGSPGTTTTTTDTNAGIAGPTSGALTSASTTAPVPSDQAADQSDANLASFFGSGTSSTPQYDQTAATSNEPQTSSAQKGGGA